MVTVRDEHKAARRSRLKHIPEDMFKLKATTESRLSRALKRPGLGYRADRFISLEEVPTPEGLLDFPQVAKMVPSNGPVEGQEDYYSTAEVSENASIRGGQEAQNSNIWCY